MSWPRCCTAEGGNDHRGGGVMSVSTRPLDGYVDRACPPWGCSLQYGHGWTDGWEDEGEQFREHGRHVGDHVHLGTRERVDEPNDLSLQSTTFSPTISVFDGLERHDMTAEQARQHSAVVRQAADDLLKAADEVDRIEAATA
jgi:hypothetical protein